MNAGTQPGDAKLVIRRPNPARFADEVNAVADLFLASRRATMPRLKALHADAETREWMREIVFPRRSIRIAQIGDEIVGFAARDGAWLEHLYVKPGWTGRGIGRALLDVVIGEARAVTPVLRLYTFQANQGARRFYEQNGFVAVAFSSGSNNEEGEPDVRYERTIR